MTRNLLLAVVFGLLLAGSLCIADDGSARRYAEFSELYGYDNMSRMFSLLERKDVQDELKMGPDQVAKVKHIACAPEEDIPGLLELKPKYKNKLSDPALSPSEKRRLIESYNSDFRKCIDAYHCKELPAALSASQRQRLGELVMQMRGPITIVDDATASSKLQLSRKQRADMKETVKDYEKELEWLQRRYGKKHISGISWGETEEDREKELEALFVVIRAMERERDRNLLVKLTPDQLALWREIQGKPFPISWPRTSVFDSPFREENNTDVEGKQGKQVPGTVSDEGGTR